MRGGKNAELECADCSPGLQWIQQSRLILWGTCLLFFYIKMCAVLCICNFIFWKTLVFGIKQKYFGNFKFDLIERTNAFTQKKKRKKSY